MIILIQEDRLQEIKKYPFLDKNKGTFITIEKSGDRDVYRCIDNRSGAAYEKTVNLPTEAVMWFKGILI